MNQLTTVNKRHRQRSISITNQLYNEIQQETKNIMSVSSFIRKAIKKELNHLKEKK